MPDPSQQRSKPPDFPDFPDFPDAPEVPETTAAESSRAELILRTTLPWREALLAGAVFLSALIAILVTRSPGGIALFWPANAIAAAVLIRLRTVRWSTALALLAAALFAVNAGIDHRPVSVALLFTCVNLVEVALTVAAFRFAWAFPYPDISIAQAAIMTAVMGIAIPGITALAGAGILRHALGLPFLAALSQWWSSHTLGACLLGPPIILYSRSGAARLVRRQFVTENFLVLLGCVAASYLLLRYVRFPFVTVSLLLLIAAFRLGGFGTSLLSTAIGLVITNLWLLDVRPIGLEAQASVSTLIDLPLVALLATVMPPITVGLGSDARRMLTARLRQSERQFRESLERSPLGMLVAELDGIWSYTNQALQKLLGYSAEEFRAMPPGGPADPQDWRASVERRRPLLEGRVDSYDTQRRFRHKAGHWIWTHVAVSLLRDAQGVPSHLIAQIENLETRRGIEAALAEERERLRITLLSIDDAVITTDAHNQITYINRAAEGLLGVSLQTAVRRRVDEIIHLVDPASSREASDLIGQSAIHGKVLRREHPCLLHRADGTAMHVTDVVSPVLDGTGMFTGAVMVLRDCTHEVDRIRDLKARAIHDPLTGLLNRAEFDERLGRAFQKSRQLERPAAVLAIDLDRFKPVNDSAGHAAGDQVLREVAQRCRLAVRGSDTLARLGGDEFAIVLENCSLERVRVIGERILQMLNPVSVEWEGVLHTVGASVGVAMYSTGMADEKAWLDAADKACYRAKIEGRGQLRIGFSAAGTIASA